MPNLPIDSLHPHPANANIMPKPLLQKLARHIERTGRYPAVIVRPHPDEPDAYQIIDGHHRVLALQQLCRTEVHCDVWDADDEQTLLLLTTLNRLHGEDDPVKRGMLLAQLSQRIDVQALTALLPEESERIERLIALTQPPAIALEAPVPLRDMSTTLSFFLTSAQRDAVLMKLREIDRDRTQALLIGLSLT